MTVRRSIALASLAPLLTSVAVAGIARPAAAAQGDIYTAAGSGAIGYRGDGVPARSASLSPSDVVIDAQGNPLVLDGRANRLRVMAASASNPGYVLGGCASACTWSIGAIYTIAGNGGEEYAGDGIPALSTGIRAFGPGLAHDAAGNPVFVDWNSQRVRVVAVSASNPGYSLAGCTGPCTWIVGDIYTIAGNGLFGYSGDGSAATAAALDSPNGLAIDAENNALISAENSQRVRVVAVSASNPGYLLAGCPGACTWTVGNIYTIAGTGTAGYRGDGGPATGAQLHGPWSLALDAGGNLVIGDTSNSRVRVVAVSASVPGYALAGCAGACTWTVGDIYTVVGNGVAGFGGGGGPAVGSPIERAHWTFDHHGNLLGGDGTLVRIVAVSVDPAGNVYIADERDGRVRELIVVPTPPDFPQSVSATPGNARAMLAWSRPTSNGGSPVTNYIVTPYLGSTALAPHVFDATATSGLITGLTNGKRYTFKVAAASVLGTGPASTTSAIAVGAPDPPSGVTVTPNATARNTGALTVAYKPGANNGAPITKYTATCRPRSPHAGDSPLVGARFGSSAAAVPIVVAGLETTRAFVCTVRATNARGDGSESGVSQFARVGAPGAPTGAHPVRVAAGVFKVNFSPGPNGGAKTTGYAVMCTEALGDVHVQAGGRASPVTVHGLTAGTFYSCTVTGDNARGYGPPSLASPAVKA